MRCETCAHWERVDERYNHVDDYEVREALIAQDVSGESLDAEVERIAAENKGRWGRCRFVTHGWGDSQRAYTYDASSYASGLCTRDDFGCVEHEARAEEGE